MSNATASAPALVVLDRDGVINCESPDYIRSVADWEPLPGAITAIAALGRAGFRVVIATNQSGLGRGYFNEATLRDIHAVMQQAVTDAGGQIDGIFYCPHGPDDGCDCRKPRPGLLQQIGRQFEIELKNVPVIGDSGRDLDAALAVGARPILVRTGNGERTARSYASLDRVEIYADLSEAAGKLISERAALK